MENNNMDSPAFMVVFRGELADGAQLEQVKEKLQEVFRLSHDKVEQIFALPAVVVKKGLSKELAQRFQQQLHQLGVVTDVAAMEGDAEIAVVAVSAPAADRAISALRHGEDGGAGGTTAMAAHGVAGGEGRQRLQVEFGGQGSEYFKIWIANVFLSLLTLGIYSAWAKVRNHRYFYGNTRIGSGSFEYLAEPRAILKGRMVAFGLLFLFSLTGELMPQVGMVLQVLLLALLPWLIVRSLAFRYRNTAYRNVRFDFTGRFGGAFMAFLLWPLIGILTLGLALPHAIYRQKRYIIEHSRYGTTPFTPNFESGSFYGIVLRALALAIVATLLFFSSHFYPLLALPAIPAGLALYLVAFAFFSANVNNLVFNGTTLAGHGFDSRLQTGRLAWLYLSNWLMVTFTLGLAMPWARVRLARYRAGCLALLAAGSLDHFFAAEQEKVSALGEEIGDAFDMDIGL